ncbi:MAG TPA: hypothetical protein VFP90_17165 [Gemmatimonadaceae bacterium]|nr:hypothetical protein [Gemmatimonadaceae bacterium]
MADLLLVSSHDVLGCRYQLRGEADRRRQLDRRIEPELRLAVRVRNVNMHTPLLA